MTTTSELPHLFRALKAPAAARALPKLAERARAEEWSYERFAEALLASETSSREAHGGDSIGYEPVTPRALSTLSPPGGGRRGTSKTGRPMIQWTASP